MLWYSVIEMITCLYLDSLILLWQQRIYLFRDKELDPFAKYLTGS